MRNEIAAFQAEGFGFRPLQAGQDAALLQSWFGEARASFWGMQAYSVAEVAGFYGRLQASGHAQAWLGLEDGVPAFLIETYAPAHEEVGKHYPVQAGDLGMHVFIGPAASPQRGYSQRVFRALMHFLFDALGARRIVVEPNALNQRVHVLNRRVGFVYCKDVSFPDKTASIAFCTRSDFHHSLKHKDVPAMSAPQHPAQIASHLNPEIWAKVNRLLVRKAIAEYAHELIIEPERLGEPDADGYALYQLKPEHSARVYRFRARLLALRHWSIPADSLVCLHGGETVAPDALHFILDCRSLLGIRDELLPVYLDEISSTLFGSAYKHLKHSPASAELVDADFQTIETAMMEGHPGFVANNGRLGFNAIDYRAYAPEAGAEIAVVWLAVHKDHAAFHCAADLDYERLLAEELGEATVAGFLEAIRAQGCDPAHYHLMPAHPWQWFNKLSIAFASYVAQQKIICLGFGDDQYRAQQSIRTFFNTSAPDKRYVKTSLSILNMGFMRGLSPYYMSGTPAINDYIHGLVSQDPWLQRHGFSILREVASLGFRNHYYEAALQVDSPYKKMFSALWRESPLARVQAGEQLMTMAALLHVDRDGEALLPALIAASRLAVSDWLAHYLDAYLSPLLHCFYAYDLVFMPHGENLILVLENHVPVRAIMKDIAEESAILDKDRQLPANVQRLAVDVPDEVKLLAIFIDVFDGFFRYVNQLLVEHGCCEEALFWQAVADCITRYQHAHPQYAAKYRQYDLFAPEFLHSCLNRLQLGNNLQMINLADPAANLKMAGNLRNPLAGLGAAVAHSELLSGEPA